SQVSGNPQQSLAITPDSRSRCHSGDLYYPWGVVERMGRPDRDGHDTPFSQLVLDLWTSFGKTHDPNPDANYLALRGYTNTSMQLAQSGPWIEVNPEEPTRMMLTWPTRQR